MRNNAKGIQIRRALLSVSDKSELVPLAKALHKAGAELVATGRTATVLTDAGLPITPIEKVSGSPEAFQGRMKTLSFPVCSGILYRRGDKSDESDLKRLGVSPIDCVVVNFYPFEEAAAMTDISRDRLIEEVDIGGPTLVRAAAKNSPDVLVLTDPSQYSQVIEDLVTHGKVQIATVEDCSAAAWERVLHYDSAIARELGQRGKRVLRYGENPHQKGLLEFDPQGPVAWDEKLTPAELSYNNILDLTAAYGLASDLVELSSQSTGVVIIKHNNPCGVALVPKNSRSQLDALKLAWAGDPVSAFGGVLVFTDSIEIETANWLGEKFVELIAAPGLSEGNTELKVLLTKRKNLKAVTIREFGRMPSEQMMMVPGGRLYQTSDSGLEGEDFQSVTEKKWPESKKKLGLFGVAVCRALKSNSIALVREIEGAFQLVGAGQGQPNRIDALKILAVPRAIKVLSEDEGESSLADCIMVSDAFFPFRDTVDAAADAGIRSIIQPGGSIKDKESIQACDEHGIAMVFTGRRHFRH